MKSLLTALAVCGLATIVGCSSTNSQAVNPGAVDASEGSSCASSCSSEKASCPYSGDSEVAPAAVHSAPSCSSSSSCSKSCSKETDG